MQYLTEYTTEKLSAYVLSRKIGKKYLIVIHDKIVAYIYGVR